MEMNLNRFISGLNLISQPKTKENNFSTRHDSFQRL